MNNLNERITVKNHNDQVMHYFEGIIQDIDKHNNDEHLSYEKLNQLIDQLLSISDDDIILSIIRSANYNEVLPSNVPQFSNFEKCIKDVLYTLIMMNRSLTFEEIGKFLVDAHKKTANIKYGENHAKTSELFMLVKITKSKRKHVDITHFGKYSLTLEENVRRQILKKILLHNNFIKMLIIHSYTENTSKLTDLCYMLSQTTISRRKSNIKQLFIFSVDKTKFEFLTKKISWRL